MTRLLCVIMLSLLVGCGTIFERSKKPDPPISASQTSKVHVDPRVFERCPILEKQQINSPDDFLPALNKVTSPYKVCSDKLDTAIKVIKDLTNNQ